MAKNQPIRKRESWKQPPLKETTCSVCKADCKSNDAAPMCANCQEMYSEISDQRQADIREKTSRAQLAEAQLDVILNGAAAHGQAVKILDSMLDCFGGPEGLAKSWYADCMIVMTEKAGTSNSQMMFRKIAEFVLQVSKTAAAELGGIDAMDRSEVEDELKRYEREFGVITAEDPDVITIEDQNDDDQNAVA